MPDQYRVQWRGSGWVKTTAPFFQTAGLYINSNTMHVSACHNNIQGHLLLVLRMGIISSEEEQRVKRQALADVHEVTQHLQA